MLKINLSSPKLLLVASLFSSSCVFAQPVSDVIINKSTLKVIPNKHIEARLMRGITSTINLPVLFSSGDCVFIGKHKADLDINIFIIELYSASCYDKDNQLFISNNIKSFVFGEDRMFGIAGTLKESSVKKAIDNNTSTLDLNNIAVRKMVEDFKLLSPYLEAYMGAKAVIYLNEGDFTKEEENLQ